MNHLLLQMKRRIKTTNSAPSVVTALWEEGYFATKRTFNELSLLLEERGTNFIPDTLRKALKSSSHIMPYKKVKPPQYIQKKPPISKKFVATHDLLFEESLIKNLGKPFESEITDLHLNFGRSGNCTAFLLRKVLEKLIYITFAKNKLETKLADKNLPHRLIGLEAMIDVASKEKVNGIPFLTNSTATSIKGIKFLGDTSAHNPLVNVDIVTIVPQMPFIVTAYKELAARL